LRLLIIMLSNKQTAQKNQNGTQFVKIGNKTILTMKVCNDNLIEGENSFQNKEAEFLASYLMNSALYGFYYDSNNKSYGISLQFLSTGNSRMNLYAVESQGSLSVIEYRISSNDFSIDSVAYDKVLITATDFNVESILPISLTVQLPTRLAFTLQLLTRNSLYIKFSDSDQYTSPIKSIKGGLILAREQTEYLNQPFEAVYESSGFFHA
jgi:hypothetical protein